MNKYLKNTLSNMVAFTATVATVLTMLPVNVYASPDKNERHIEKTSETPVIEVTYETGSQNTAKERRDDNEAEKSENDGSYEVVIPDGNAITDENGEIIVDSTEPEEIQWEDIHIKTSEDFEEFAENCKLDTWSRNKNVYLEDDIVIVNSEQHSVPTFGGHFYGKDHTINGYNMHESRSYTGLFNYVQEGAVIESLVVKASVKAEGNQIVTGGIVGENHGELRNCVFEGSVSGDSYVGGICGYNELTGNILNCRSLGEVTGAYYTGGIAGENVGNISSCVNEANINTVMVDHASSIQDIDIASYADGILSKITGNTSEKEKKTALVDSGSVDTGGIAGISIGVIQFCENIGEVGYEHVGYNVGGIAGRQSGYIHGCSNKGVIKGRKDVGGIVGQAEPYVVVDFTEDVITKLSENIDKLHDIIDDTLSDAGASSDTISNRLSIVKSFTDRALDETSFLSNKTIDFTNSMVSAGNDLMSRAQYIISETSKDDGPLDDGKKSANDAKEAAKKLDDTVRDLDIYKYMSDDQKASYDDSRDKFNYLTKTKAEYAEIYTKAAEHYYINKLSKEDETAEEPKYANAHDLVAYDKEGNSLDISAFGTDLEMWKMIVSWKHADGELLGSKEGDAQLMKDATKAYKDAVIPPSVSSVEALADSKTEADYEAKYGKALASVDREISDQGSEMAGIIISVTPQMEEATRKDASDAANAVKDSTEHIADATKQTKGILSEIASRGGISMPTLDDDYRNSTNALNAALKGMSDNMGALNDEMSRSSDVMIDDMGGVNDQFNVIMQLYTDAIDGVLDKDYGDTIEDNSMEVAATCVDATIADSENSGKIEGDLDVSGIAGAMGVEYDFDLESDITKSKDSTFSSTYQSKCVLRNNKNNAHIIAQKSYAGGICGLQEIGTILQCENYGKVKSNSGDYVGGISGDSLSYIQKSVSKCFLVGQNYVGGIAGHGCNILNCYAMVEIDDKEADSYYGAIAGDITENGKVHYNYYVGDSLAGIDRISVKGQAEEIDYETFISMDTTPKECEKLYAVFYIDDIETDRIETTYGGTVLKDEFPVYIKDDGTYCKWSKGDLIEMSFDAEVEGEYARYITTLASDQMRMNDQSAILVDGRFKDGDKLQSTLWDVNNFSIENAIEHWELSIPGDLNEVHLIRYKAPDNADGDVEILVNNAGKWEKVSTGSFGIYKTFEISGPYAELAIVSVKKTYTKEIVIGVVVTIIVILLLVLIISKARKNKKKLSEMPDAETADDDSMENAASDKESTDDDIEIIKL